MPLKTTPLHQAHIDLAARMVAFGGWDMPVQYAGVISEHLAVRNHAGVFDVSHMGEFFIAGPEALAFLQFATVNDVAKIKSGRAQYNMLPNNTGGLVDDIYVYRIAEQDYMMVVNAANIEKDFEHLLKLKTNFDCTLQNRSDDYGLLAVQGPDTEKLLDPHCDSSLQDRKKNSVFSTEIFGYPVRMARTGYTGEDGFEIFCASNDTVHVWQKILELGIAPCGLGARDTLRLEAGFPLYGHEFTDSISPLATPFAWAVKEYKDFFGRAAMLSKISSQHLVGLRVVGRGIPREGYAIKQNDVVVGHCSSGTMSPSLKTGIALAYVEQGLETGAKVMLDVRGTDIEAEIVEPVFVSRGSPGPGV